MVGQAEAQVLKEQIKQHQQEVGQLKKLVKEMKDELACKDRRIEKLDSAKITVELATTFQKIKEERSQYAKEVYTTKYLKSHKKLLCGKQIDPIRIFRQQNKVSSAEKALLFFSISKTIFMASLLLFYGNPESGDA